MATDEPTSSRDDTDLSVPPREERKKNLQLSAFVAAVPSIGEGLRSVAVTGVATFGRASTGTLIRSLHGAPKADATSAWFGLGSKASGGAGKAGGNAVIAALGYLPLAGALALDIAAIVRDERRRSGKPLDGDLSTEETLRL